LIRFDSDSAALRAVALFEAAKGTLVLAAGVGLLGLLHRDADRIAGLLVSRLHLNPASKRARIFLDLLADLSSGKLWLLAALAVTYAAVRFIEAYGLWRGRAWAKWMAVVSGGIYVPFEIYELYTGVTWLKLAALLVNGAVVAYMGRDLWSKQFFKRKKIGL
jgi:uncharacterized membrane protein (DUF2068 family)